MEKARDTSNCPYCLSPIEATEEQIRCPVCGVVHHAECWQMNGKCSVYGCDGWQSWSGAISEKIAPRIREEIDIGDGETEPVAHSQDTGPRCIECGQPVRPGQLVCPGCRGDWRPGWLENCSGPMLIMIGVFAGIVSLIVKGLS